MREMRLDMVSSCGVGTGKERRYKSNHSKFEPFCQSKTPRHLAMRGGRFSLLEAEDTLELIDAHRLRDRVSVQPLQLSIVSMVDVARVRDEQGRRVEALRNPVDIKGGCAREVDVAHDHIEVLAAQEAHGFHALRRVHDVQALA